MTLRKRFGFDALYVFTFFACFHSFWILILSFVIVVSVEVYEIKEKKLYYLCLLEMEERWRRRRLDGRREGYT